MPWWLSKIERDPSRNADLPWDEIQKANRFPLANGFCWIESKRPCYNDGDMIGKANIGTTTDGERRADFTRSAGVIHPVQQLPRHSPLKTQKASGFSPTARRFSFNLQNLFLFFPIRRKPDFQCCQRYMFRQGSDDRLMNDFRGEERQLQHVGNK